MKDINSRCKIVLQISHERNLPYSQPVKKNLGSRSIAALQLTQKKVRILSKS